MHQLMRMQIRQTSQYLTHHIRYLWLHKHHLPLHVVEWPPVTIFHHHVRFPVVKKWFDVPHYVLVVATPHYFCPKKSFFFMRILMRIFFKEFFQRNIFFVKYFLFITYFLKIFWLEFLIGIFFLFWIRIQLQ